MPHRPLRVGDAFHVARHVLWVRHAIIHWSQTVTAPRKILRNLNQPATTREVLCNICCCHAAMVGHKAVSNFQNLCPLPRIARLNGEITFGIRTHGAIIQIGRTDPQELIIDDHHLRMHHRVGDRPPAFDLRVDKANAVGDAGLLQGVQEADAPVAHGARLHPGFMVLRSNQQGFERGLGQHALGDALRRNTGRKKLVLDVKRALGCID